MILADAQYSVVYLLGANTSAMYRKRTRDLWFRCYRIIKLLSLSCYAII